jgi:hypothetical protein
MKNVWHCHFQLSANQSESVPVVPTDFYPDLDEQPEIGYAVLTRAGAQSRV